MVDLEKNLGTATLGPPRSNTSCTHGHVVRCTQVSGNPKNAFTPHFSISPKECCSEPRVVAVRYSSKLASIKRATNLNGSVPSTLSSWG